MKKLLANALGEMKSRKESEASVEEFRRRNEALEAENGKLLQVTCICRLSTASSSVRKCVGEIWASFGKIVLVWRNFYLNSCVNSRAQLEEGEHISSLQISLFFGTSYLAQIPCNSIFSN